MRAPQPVDEPLWVNQNPTESYMWEFRQLINQKYGKNLESYDDLYDWSIECLPQFWEEVWAFTGVNAAPYVSKGVEGQNGYHITEKKPFKRVSYISLVELIAFAEL